MCLYKAARLQKILVASFVHYEVIEDQKWIVRKGCYGRAAFLLYLAGSLTSPQICHFDEDRSEWKSYWLIKFHFTSENFSVFWYKRFLLKFLPTMVMMLIMTTIMSFDIATKHKGKYYSINLWVAISYVNRKFGWVFVSSNCTIKYALTTPTAGDFLWINY